MGNLNPEATVPNGELLPNAEILQINTGAAEQPYKSPGEDRIIQHEQLG
jgi:hypothetical protein